ELEKTIEMKDELLLLITHELKTPLSVITSSIQAIESICKNELTDRVGKYLNKIRQNTYRQLKLVNNILDNTRVKSGLFKLNQTNVDVVNLTSMIIESIMVCAERKKIKVSFSSALDRMIIKADVDQYERVLLNLLSNAVKFTPEEKSIEVKIFQFVKNGTQRACIQIKDQGIGIPNDKKEYIFERFGRVDKLNAGNAEGTGIGLYLVKMLVDLMDGEIELESEEGTGSIFTLIFPLLSSAIEHASIEKPNERLATAAAIEFSDIYYRV
ncbi:MAG: HAMP domain-containing sensor histidine kinase, partial [Bacillota bacterium]